MNRWMLVLLPLLGGLACGGQLATNEESLATPGASEEAVLTLTAEAMAALAPPPRLPPQEAIDACASLAAGDACSFALGGRTVAGTCRLGPDGLKSACAPSDSPPPPPKDQGAPKPPPQAALDACASLSADAPCSVVLDGHTISGRCVAGPQGAAAACLPPPPCMPPMGPAVDATLQLPGESPAPVKVWVGRAPPEQRPPLFVDLGDGRRLAPVGPPPPADAPAPRMVTLEIRNGSETLAKAPYVGVSCAQ